MKLGVTRDLILMLASRGPFLESPGNLTGPQPIFQISIKVGCVLTSNEVHFVSLAANFTA